MNGFIFCSVSSFQLLYISYWLEKLLVWTTESKIRFRIACFYTARLSSSFSSSSGWPSLWGVFSLPNDTFCFFSNIFLSFNSTRSWINFRILMKIKNMCSVFLHKPKGWAPSAGEEMFQEWGLKSWSCGSDPEIWWSRRVQGHWQDILWKNAPRRILQEWTLRKLLRFNKPHQHSSESGQHII